MGGEGSEEEKVTAKIKISGPEQIFAYLIHFINLITSLQHPDAQRPRVRTDHQESRDSQCNVCTFVVSPQCELGSGSSN